MCIYKYFACFLCEVRIFKGPVVRMPFGGATGLFVELGNVCRIPKMSLVWVHVADEVLSTAQGNHSNIAKRAAGSSNAAKKTAIVENLRHPHTSPWIAVPMVCFRTDTPSK